MWFFSEFVDALRWCTLHGINAASIIGFAVATALAVQPGNWVVKTLQQSELRKFAKRLAEKDDTKDWKERCAALINLYDFEWGALIGKMERSLYVYSVMNPQASVLAGWLVLKAFWGWIEVQNENRKERFRAEEKLSMYNIYLHGNVLSIMVGLFCGEFGKLIKAWLIYVQNP